MEKFNSTKTYTIDNSFLNTGEKPEDMNVFVILLNRKFEGDLTKKLIEISDYFICADGGSNRLYDHLREDSERLNYKPSVILGDMDSIRPEVREYYKEQGIDIIIKTSQDDNDSEKALNHLSQTYDENEEWQKKKESRVFVIGSFGGRLDHTLSNLSILNGFSSQMDSKYGNFTLCMISKGTMALCLLPGETKYVRASSLESDSGVGLMPLCGPCDYCNTKGFKWDLGESFSRLEFGSFVSSSNEFLNSKEVTVKNSAPLVLLISFKT